MATECDSAFPAATKDLGKPICSVRSWRENNKSATQSRQLLLCCSGARRRTLRSWNTTQKSSIFFRNRATTVVIVRDGNKISKTEFTTIRWFENVHLLVQMRFVLMTSYISIVLLLYPFPDSCSQAATTALESEFIEAIICECFVKKLAERFSRCSCASISVSMLS